MIEDSTYKTLAFYVYRIRSSTKSTQKLQASSCLSLHVYYVYACISLYIFKPLPLSTITQLLNSLLLLGFSFFLNIKCKSGLILLVPLLHYLICLSCFFLFHVLLGCVLCVMWVCVCLSEDDADDEEDDMTRKYKK